ncbi:acyltransferase [Pseudonocardia sp. S2-4]|uniref:Acyltransferase n=1 Tax=Pseudonocardia humida TaxID=2800819 RepID=A0ABT0ZT41_9PSEU|nr:acyltransferase [Pseudonocardia humida]
MVAYHAGLPVQGGFVGVDVFFVISGFVITMLLLRELAAHGRIRFRRFYARRIRRLLPALALVLTVTALLSMVLQSPFGSQQDTAVAGVGASMWLANVALYLVTGDYFDNAAETIPLLHTWSLAVEEQFYLVFPVLLAVGYWWGRRKQRRGVGGATLVMAAVVAASFAISLWLSYGHGLPFIDKPSTAAFYSAPSRAWEFGIGGLVALWADRGTPLSRAAGAAVGWTGAALLLAAATLIPDTAVFPGSVAVVPVVGTALVIVGGRTEGGALGRLLARRPLQAIGDVSYSWYLWHWPLIVFAHLVWPSDSGVTVAAAVIALPLAWASYTYFEQPIRRGGGLSAWATVRLAVVSIVVPILLFGVVYAEATRSWGNPAIAAMAEQVRPVPTGYREGCHSSTPVPARNLTRCTFEGRPGGPRVFLVGDSNAGQYAEAVIDAGRALDRTVVLATMSGCPLIDLVFERAGRPDDDCRIFQEQSTRWLTEQAGASIVIAAANEAINDPEVTLRDPLTGEGASEPSAKQRLWAAGLERTLTALKSAGHAVLMVNVIPHLGGDQQRWWSPSQCALPTLRDSVSDCGVEVPLQDVDETQARARTAEHDAAASAGVQEMDLRAVLCPDSSCRSVRDGVWIYRDGLHISTRQSHALAGEFEIALGGNP